MWESLLYTIPINTEFFLLYLNVSSNLLTYRPDDNLRNKLLIVNGILVFIISHIRLILGYLIVDLPI